MISHSPNQTNEIATEVAQKAIASMASRVTATVISLSGELGAGKTTFAQGFARTLSVSQNLRSPTFTLAKSYLIPNSDFILWHIDCYRLEKPEDAHAIDLPTILNNPKALVLIEWPERIRLNIRHWDIRFSHGDSENERKISITVT